MSSLNKDVARISHPLGLETLFEGEAPLVADLVFVHGLGGHRRDTWTKDGVCWPEELLPKEEAFSHVRILTFGYDDNIVGPMGRASLNLLFDHSINLLHELSRERRRDARDRPIIFVAHSLGGLIVKDALSCSRDVTETNPSLARIFSATRGIIFIGTPHRGSGTASLANLVASVAQATLQSESRNLIGDLESSPVLARIKDDFSRLLDERTFAVWSFVEELPMTGGEKVVCDESAIIGDTRESRETIYADHAGMTKLSATDDGYKKIIHTIEMVLDELIEFGQKSQPLPHSTPSPSTLFTGRREYLERLRQHFFLEGSQPRARKTFALYGLAGGGKTQICMKFAHEHADRFKYIFWIDATNPETMELSFKFIADYPEARAGVKASVQSTLQWISWIVDPWLLVIDNAENPGTVSKCMPHGNYGNVLITSRNPGVCHHSPGAHAEVEKMEEEDAVTLLLKAAFLAIGSEDLRHTSRAIVKELCCLPLAIDQAGVFIAGGMCNINSYLQMYTYHRHKMLDYPSFRIASGMAVYGTWDLSFEAMVNLENGPGVEGVKNATILLQILSFLHHDNITKEIFRQAARSDYEHNVDMLSSSADILSKLLHIRNGGEWDPSFFKQGIQTLLSFSFLRRSGANVYSMHPLVHQWSRDRMTFSEQQLGYQHARKLLCHSITWNFSSADYAFRQTLIPHIKANNQYGSEVGVTSTYNEHEYSKFALVFCENGYWKEAEELQVMVMETRKEVLGTEHPDTLTSVDNLASTYLNQGRWKEAEELQIKVMETRKRVLGAEHPHTLTSMDGLALTYWNQGMWKEAEELQVMVMETRNRILGTENSDTLTSMSNLASTYLVQGTWKEAEKLQVMVMETRLRVLGAEHPDTQTSIDNLALTFQIQEKLIEAEELQVKVMETRLKVLGEEHPNTLTSMHNLALTCQNQGNLIKAEKLQVRVMEIRSRVLGTEHPDTLTTMDNLASTYKNQGWLEKAEKLQVRVMETKRRVLGAEHPDTLTSMDSLASIYWNQGKLTEAEELHFTVIETRRRVLGTEHPDTLTTMHNLASIYRNQGKSKEVEEHQAKENTSGPAPFKIPDFAIAQTLNPAKNMGLDGRVSTEQYQGLNNNESTSLVQLIESYNVTTDADNIIASDSMVESLKTCKIDTDALNPVSCLCIEQFLLGATDALNHAKNKEHKIQAILLDTGISNKYYYLQAGFNQSLIEKNGGLLQEIYTIISKEISPDNLLLLNLGKEFFPYPGVIVTPSNSYQTSVFKDDGSVWELNDFVLSQTEESANSLLLHLMPSFNKCTISCVTGTVTTSSTGVSGNNDSKQNKKGKGKEREENENPNHEDHGNGNMGGDFGDPKNGGNEERPKIRFDVETRLKVKHLKDIPRPLSSQGNLVQSNNIAPQHDQNESLEMDVLPVNSQGPQGEGQKHSWIYTITSKILHFISKGNHAPTSHINVTQSNHNPSPAHCDPTLQDFGLQQVFQTLQVRGEILPQVQTTPSQPSTLHLEFTKLKFQGHLKASSEYQQSCVRVAIDTTDQNTWVDFVKPSGTRRHQDTKKQTKSRKATRSLAGMFGMSGHFPLFNLICGGAHERESLSAEEIMIYDSRVVVDDNDGVVRWIIDVDDEHEKCGIEIMKGKLPEAHFTFVAEGYHPPPPKSVHIEVASYWSLAPSSRKKSPINPFYNNLCQIVLLKVPTNLSSDSNYRAKLEGLNSENKNVLPVLRGVIPVTPTTIPVGDVDVHSREINCLLQENQAQENRAQENGYAHLSILLPTVPRQREGSSQQVMEQGEQMTPSAPGPSKIVPYDV